MKVLSIDLDYIMYPTIHSYNDIAWDDNPLVRWNKFYEISDDDESNLFYDEVRLQFLKDLFTKVIQNCDNVKFDYEHDNILYYLKNHKSIELINIDHHDDILCDSYDLDFDGDGDDDRKHDLNLEFTHLREYDSVNEGNWIGWLASKRKLKSFSWIGNNGWIDDEKLETVRELIPNINVDYTLNHNFGDYKFDLVFLCLSPCFIPPEFWNLFTWFIDEYEKKYNVTVNPKDWDSRKIEIEMRYSKVTDEILHKRSTDRKPVSGEGI